MYGASTGGHEQDVADYEIFLWRVGDPPEEVVRLTAHTGNDNWPDFYSLKSCLGKSPCGAGGPAA